MNAKQAKALRRLARQSGLEQQESHLINRKTGVIVVDPRCARGLYRAMKKHFNQQEGSQCFNYWRSTASA